MIEKTFKGCFRELHLIRCKNENSLSMSRRSECE